MPPKAPSPYVPRSILDWGSSQDPDDLREERRNAEMAGWKRQLTPSGAEYFKAVTANAFLEGPAATVIRDLDRSAAARMDSKTLSAQEYKDSDYFREGLHFRDGEKESVIQTSVAQYDAKQKHRDVISRGMEEHGMGPTFWTGQIVGSLLDPIGLLTTVMPVAGEAEIINTTYRLSRAGRTAAKARNVPRDAIKLIESMDDLSTIGKIGARTAVGGGVGATQQAMWDIPRAMTADEEGEDFTAGDALVNILAGGLGGAVLQNVAGGFGDYLRSHSREEFAKKVTLTQQQLLAGETVDLPMGHTLDGPEMAHIGQKVVDTPHPLVREPSPAPVDTSPAPILTPAQYQTEMVERVIDKAPAKASPAKKAAARKAHIKQKKEDTTELKKMVEARDSVPSLPEKEAIVVEYKTKKASKQKGTKQKGAKTPEPVDAAPAKTPEPVNAAPAVTPEPVKADASVFDRVTQEVDWRDEITRWLLGAKATHFEKAADDIAEELQDNGLKKFKNEWKWENGEELTHAEAIEVMQDVGIDTSAVNLDSLPKGNELILKRTLTPQQRHLAESGEAHLSEALEHDPVYAPSDIEKLVDRMEDELELAVVDDRLDRDLQREYLEVRTQRDDIHTVYDDLDAFVECLTA